MLRNANISMDEEGTLLLFSVTCLHPMYLSVSEAYLLHSDLQLPMEAFTAFRDRLSLMRLLYGAHIKTKFNLTHTDIYHQKCNFLLDR